MIWSSWGQDYKQRLPEFAFSKFVVVMVKWHAMERLTVCWIDTSWYVDYYFHICQYCSGQFFGNISISLFRIIRPESELEKTWLVSVINYLPMQEFVSKIINSVWGLVPKQDAALHRSLSTRPSAPASAATTAPPVRHFALHLSERPPIRLLKYTPLRLVWLIPFVIHQKVKRWTLDRWSRESCMWEAVGKYVLVGHTPT